MTAPDFASALKVLRGRLTPDAPLAPYTWFRVGGPAQMLFQPADEEDLAACLSQLPLDAPVTVLGLGSNLIVRDGGVAGLTIRLGGAMLGTIETTVDHRVLAGAAAPDMRVAQAAAEAGIAGLAFYRGIPGSIGGALRMNAGAHGGETRDVLIEAHGVDRRGNRKVFSNAEMGFAYRHNSAPPDIIFTRAIFQGRAGARETVIAEMERVTAARQAAQPIREKTGGSTFKNPPGHKAWVLIDAAGCRGLRLGGALVSPLHCNFLINTGAATAGEIEALGEEVRRRVRETSGIDLEWEIKRVGVAGK
jgi:UDP-N-acetylmuramate dehydrogenase